MGCHGDVAEDVATSSNFRDVQVKKYELDLTVNFELKELQGECTLPCVALKPVKEVVLDIHEALKVKNVANEDGKKLDFVVKSFTSYGTTLHIQLVSEVTSGSEFTVKIEYVATGGPGVIWLEPSQTAGKVKPYMYTQGQAVMNRSFFPNQDTPAVKAPYSATVRVPDGFTAVMSANSCSSDGNVYRFEQSVPVPSYLVALAVGDLVSAEIGPRSRVWTEPCLLETARQEFDGNVEKVIITGEMLFGPYVWGRCDLLITPPSFPYGGMENPCLTFLHPCAISGDKSLATVLIHEICHSWFGNLVTNANWSEFWLNEGFTRFAQRRVEEKFFGSAHASLEARTGRELLRQHMDNTGEDHPLNRLRVVIEPGMDPDETYNETPYEKGFVFLCYLQSLVGDVDKFDEFLKSYVNKYKFKSVVAEDMLEYYLEYFPHLPDQQVDKKEGLDFDTWLNKSGWPPFEPDLSAGRELTDPVEQVVEKWATFQGEVPVEDISRWEGYQLYYFLDKLLEKDSLSTETLHTFIETYPQIVNSDNAEICLRWSKIVLKNDIQKEFPKVSTFLHRQGKQKFTLPLYKLMMKGSESAKKLACETFQSTKQQLHIQIQQYVDKILRG